MQPPRDGFPRDKPASPELDLERRSELEALVARISLSFVGLAPTELDRAITNALAEIGRFVGADRSYVFLYDQEAGTASNTHEWCAEGITCEKDNLQDVPLTAFPYLLDRLENEVFVDIPTVAELPTEAGAVKESFLAQGIRSLVLVSMRSSRGQPIGFAGLDAVRQERPWYSTDHHLLQLTADLISTTLESQDLWQRLADNEARNRALLDALPDTMVAFNREGRVLEVRTSRFDPHPEISEELKASHISEFLGPAQAGIFRDAVARVEQGENPVVTEFELQQRGKKLSFEVRVTRYREGEYLALVRDITQRKRNENALRSLVLQLCTAEEGQRRELALLLHDGIGQDLSALHYQMQACFEGTAPSAHRLNKMVGLLQQVMAKTQDLTFDLSPPMLYELGLGAALQAMVRRFNRDQAGDYSLTVVGDGPEPDSTTAILLYRITRELLINAAKHSGADRVVVRLENRAENVVLTVSDNGRGFTGEDMGPKDDLRRGGFGLFSIRQRLGPLGGRLEIGNGEGARITITLPRIVTGDGDQTGGKS